MNARPSIRELDRIRRDIGARLRIDHEVAEPPPQRLMALLKELEIHVHDAEVGRLFAEVDARVAELLACGRPAASRCILDEYECGALLGQRRRMPQSRNEGGP